MRTRTLFTFWAKCDAENRMPIWVGPEAFQEFFNVPADRVQKLLGKDYLHLDEEGVKQFATAVDTLMQEVEHSAAEGRDE